MPFVRCVLLFAAVALAASACAQKLPATQQPLNADVSDFGTSYAFSGPICSGCVETELGFLSLEDQRLAPAVLTVAPAWLHGDASVLVNVLDSERERGKRTTHFGNRLDLAVREKVFDHGGLTLTLAPWGTAFIRGIQGGRAGAVALPQFTSGKNAYVAEFSWTGAIGVSDGNARSDYFEAFDYTRSVGSLGYAWFVGTAHELTAGQQTIGTEVGAVIPFQHGQVELATEQLSVNTSPQVQVQARVVMNWGKLLRR